MTFKEFNELFTVDFNIDSIISVRQSRKVSYRANYLDMPRRSMGLLLLTDCGATVDLPGGSRLQATAADVLLLPKGANYAISFSPADGNISHPVMINFRITDTAGNEQFPDCGVIRLCRDNGTLLPLFTAAAQLYKSAAPAPLKAKVYELFGTLFPLAETDECCIGYINRHYTDTFSVPQLAKRCALSETAYRKRFKALTGLSPVQYINALKIDKACLMLVSGDMSPGAISDFLNFSSPSYFYKVFKDHTGMTPNEYHNRAGLK